MRACLANSTFVFKPLLTFFFISKVIAVCQLIAEEYRLLAYHYIQRYAPRKRKASCIFTGRSRGYVSGYAASRLSFKAYAMRGEYAGVKKFVW
jgi:ribosomal protein S14